MSKRTTFTSITPLPAGIPRQLAIDFLHNHAAMIDLNPLVTARRRILPPAHALHDELVCAWYAITDRIDYLPGGLVQGAVDYTAAFHDLPGGLQTHVHAPMGVDLREKWTVGGSMPGEAPEPVELGLGAPPEGLYIREDVELRCSIVMAAFVKKTLKKAHGQVVRALAERAMEQLAVMRAGGLSPSSSTHDHDGHTHQGSGPVGAAVVAPGAASGRDPRTITFDAMLGLHPPSSSSSSSAGMLGVPGASGGRTRRPLSWIGAAGGESGTGTDEEEEEEGAAGKAGKAAVELEAHPVDVGGGGGGSGGAQRKGPGFYQMEMANRSF